MEAETWCSYHIRAESPAAKKACIQSRGLSGGSIETEHKTRTQKRARLKCEHHGILLVCCSGVCTSVQPSQGDPVLDEPSIFCWSRTRRATRDRMDDVRDSIWALVGGWTKREWMLHASWRVRVGRHAHLTFFESCILYRRVPLCTAQRYSRTALYRRVPLCTAVYRSTVQLYRWLAIWATSHEPRAGQQPRLHNNHNSTCAT